MKLWKALGLAGLAGVAATGVIIAREQRQRAQLQPDEIRAKLHERHGAAGNTAADPAVSSLMPTREGAPPDDQGEPS
jgi:hypothetical protein